MPRKRRDPESFLAEAAEEGKPADRGRLKVFLGACAGVGKTYSMLAAARIKKGEGLNLVVGLAETHGRVETQALLEGLEILPRKTIEHRGIHLSEFDLDSALKRKPALILVDELAHTNAQGSRHAKRWQDVLELLERGINVYTTLNIQHLESLNDIVAQITNIRVHETVPDSVLERADVELVDLPPGELLERLKEGKVYLPEQAAVARENFFKLPNLTALRELALRVTAEGVGVQVERQRLVTAPEATWPTVEKLLVCVGPGPDSAKLVRAAKRMAISHKADWIAVFIDATDKKVSEDERAAAIDSLRLAERLGGETLTLSAPKVPEGILDLARQRNVTKIIVGKQIRPLWLEILRGSTVDKLIRQSGDIDVYVITGESGIPVLPSERNLGELTPPKEYGIATLIVGLSTVMCFAMYPYLKLINLAMVYLLGTLIAAMRGYRGPAILASLMSVLCFDFFFVPPRFTFAVSDAEFIPTFAVMFAVGVIISHLTIRVRSQAEAARLGEMRTAAMHALSRELATTRSIDAILEVAVRHLAEVFDSEIIALIPSAYGHLEVKAWSGRKQELDEKERSVAQWVFDLGQSAGLGTQTLPVVEALYAPLIGGEGSVGVIRVQPHVRKRLLIPDQMLLLESFAHQIALALEVDRLQDNAKKAELRAETERLRSSLLSAVSHDLRTPLAAIIGSASSLLQTGASSVGGKAQELLQNIRGEAERLSRLVYNLIETTRLESGSVKLRKEPQAIEEIAGTALERLDKMLAGRDVKTDLPENLPMVPLDAVLMEQVFYNLIENAAKHTPKGTPIEISAHTTEDSLLVEVADRGPGLAPDDLVRVFEKFYRAKTPAAGAGLGLAICKAVIEAHGGQIWAENRPDDGASFRFTLPLKS